MVRQIISLTPEQLNALPPADRARFAEVVSASSSSLVTLRRLRLPVIHIHGFLHSIAKKLLVNGHCVCVTSPKTASAIDYVIYGDSAAVCMCRGTGTSKDLGDVVFAEWLPSPRRLGALFVWYSVRLRRLRYRGVQLLVERERRNIGVWKHAVKDHDESSIKNIVTPL